MQKNTNVRRTKEEVSVWYKELLEGKTQEELDIKYKTDSYYQFKKFGFKVPVNLRRKNKKKINYFFDKITNEQEAYIFGLFLSDGSISKNIVKFSQKDVAILEKVRDYICPEATINNKNLYICSKECYDNLRSIYKIETDKSHQNFSIPNMEVHLKRHFIRGYFDGDGTIYKDGKNSALRFNICSITENILKDIQEVLNSHNIETTYNCENRSKKIFYNPQGAVIKNPANMYRVKVSKKESLKRLFEFLYQDSTIFLERKHSIFNNEH